VYLYSAIYTTHSLKALRHGSQFYLQITPCRPFLRKRSPDGATLSKVANFQLQLTTQISAPKG